MIPLMSPTAGSPCIFRNFSTEQLKWQLCKVYNCVRTGDRYTSLVYSTSSDCSRKLRLEWTQLTVYIETVTYLRRYISYVNFSSEKLKPSCTQVLTNHKWRVGVLTSQTTIKGNILSFRSGSAMYRPSSRVLETSSEAYSIFCTANTAEPK